MDEVFKSFCAFGAKGGAPLMDGSKFAKLSRDCKILDKHLTSTDVDITFSKVKAPTERKINYKQFQAALKMLAEKKFPGDEGGLEKLKAQIQEAKGPALHGATKAVKSSAVDRLTDSTKFTGASKERFDATGKGKGIVGRKDVASKSGYVSGFKKDGTNSPKKVASPTKTDSPKKEAPKAESPKAESPKVESPKVESPKTDAPQE